MAASGSRRLAESFAIFPSMPSSLEAVEPKPQVYPSLTEDQRLFVDAYTDDAVSGFDAVRHCFAWLEPFEAHEVAQRLLASPRIREAIDERAALMHDQGAASAMWLVRRLVDYANVDYSDIFHESGSVKSPKHWPIDLRRMVKKLKLDPVTGEVVDIAFESKSKVLEMIGRADAVGAFDKENAGGKETLVVVRDMTRKLEHDDGSEVVVVVDGHAVPIEGAPEER